MPREVFVAGQVLTAAELNVVSDQSVMVFAGTAARGSAIPSPSEGMVTYREDDDVVEVYNGSSFVPVGPGQILQVIQQTKSIRFSTTSTSFVDITDLSLSITPSSSSSKILVHVTSSTSNSTTQGTYFQLVRGSTNIAVSTGASDANQTSASFSSGGLHIVPLAMNFLDSPSTTSSTTYKVQMRVSGGTGQLGGDAFTGVFSTLTLMEVAG